jgi:hypothetical protein
MESSRVALPGSGDVLQPAPGRSPGPWVPGGQVARSGPPGPGGSLRSSPGGEDGSPPPAPGPRAPRPAPCRPHPGPPGPPRTPRAPAPLRMAPGPWAPRAWAPGPSGRRPPGPTLVLAALLCLGPTNGRSEWPGAARSLVLHFSDTGPDPGALARPRLQGHHSC